MLCENIGCFVFTSQACLCTPCVCMASCPDNQLNTKDTDMEKALPSCDAISKVLGNKV